MTLQPIYAGALSGLDCLGRVHIVRVSELLCLFWAKKYKKIKNKMAVRVCLIANVWSILVFKAKRGLFFACHACFVCHKKCYAMSVCRFHWEHKLTLTKVIANFINAICWWLFNTKLLKGTLWFTMQPFQVVYKIHLNIKM